MFRRLPHIYFSCVVFFCTLTSQAKLPDGITGLGQQQENVSNKRVERKQWDSKKNSDLMSKKFPMQSWGKHFSSLGSKRSGISTEETQSKKFFKTEKQKFSKKEYDMSRLNERMMELHQKAGISTDDRAREIADQQMYQMALQDTKQKFNELREELSLRDINRFQFRHNRPDSDVPVQSAGRE